MRSLPGSIGPLHFVGIGGIGMSGIAEVLHNLGYRVQGSDLAESANTKRLTELGAGDWMVVEADESDGTFTRLPATAAVVTNIDPEHLDFYGDFAALQQAFETFVGSVPFYGFAVLCIDHPVVQGMVARLTDR